MGQLCPKVISEVLALDGSIDLEDPEELAVDLGSTDPANHSCDKSQLENLCYVGNEALSDPKDCPAPLKGPIQDILYKYGFIIGQ